MPAGRVQAPDGGTSSSSTSSTPNAKRPADHGTPEESRTASNGKTKLPRMERTGDDFSSVVKNRLQSYTRTGQACDRCKVRKIRCDALPEGCSHCITLNLDCYVTDRVTGRTERRGYLQQLEREKSMMATRIRDLEHMLWDKGVEVKQYEGRPCEESRSLNSEVGHDPEDGWTRVRSLCIKEHAKDTDSSRFLLPNFPRMRIPPCPVNVGIEGGLDTTGPYGSITGTKLQIMGATIDTASFEAPDLDEPPDDLDKNVPIYNKSMDAFLRSAMGKQPVMNVSLPPSKDAFAYAEWFFLVMATYMPILHKPTFMKLLRMMYEDPNFRPTSAELVQVHMVFAIIYYQYGIRNREDSVRHDHLTNLSNKHYHFSLSKFYDLLLADDLPSMQALTMISAHTRTFPKPACGAIVAIAVFTRAIELNFHRAPKVPASGSNRDIELHKRTWWVLLGTIVAVTARRARPMPIAVEDIDIDIPEPYNDDALLEDGIDETKTNDPCEWELARTTFKLFPIMMEMYAHLYSVRRDTHNYKRIVYALEAELDRVEQEVPDRMRVGNADPQHSVGALYIQASLLETRLWIRHNSVNPMTDKRLIVENTKVCEESARQLLRTVQKIIERKCLDTTWTQMSIYGFALFSMLIAGWEKRSEMTSSQFALLRKEMDEWLAVLTELSHVIGAGPGTPDAIGTMVARTLARIEADMPNSGSGHLTPTTANIPTNTPRPSPPPAQIKTELHDDQVRIQSPAPQSTLPSLPLGHRTMSLPKHPGHSSQPNTHQHPPDPTYSYGHHGLNGEPGIYPAVPYNGQHHQSNAVGGQAYDSQGGMYYGNQNQHATATVPGSGPEPGPGPGPGLGPGSGPGSGQGPGARHDVQSNPLIAFASQATHQVDPAAEQLMWQRSGTNVWQEWTAAITENQDRYGAGALLTLGGTTTTTAPMPAASIPTMEAGGQSTAHDMTTQWPLVMFDNHGGQGYQNTEQHQPNPSL